MSRTPEEQANLDLVLRMFAEVLNPMDAAAVDRFIAPDYVQHNQGVEPGRDALKAFLAMLRGEGYETIIIDPDPENGRAVRAYQKAGFRPIPELEGKTPGVLLMKHDPRFAETRP